MTALSQPGCVPKGTMLYNGQMVRALQTALSGLEGSFETVPGLLQIIADKGCWLAFKFPDREEFHWNPADFREFVESPRDAGCQTPISVLERALRGTDGWETFLRLTRGGAGAQPGEPSRNAFGRAGKPEEELNRDNITVKFPEPRDYKREAPTGTHTSYALRCLEMNAPEWLEKVRRHELTPHAAMVKSGLRDKPITVPFNPEKAARRLARHFKGADLDRLINALESTKYDDALDAEE